MNRRVKKLLVYENDVLRLLQRPEYRLVLTGLPEDVQVLRVAHEPMMRGFYYLLAHDSFPEVPDGEWIPDVGPQCYEVKRVEYPDALTASDASQHGG